MESYLATANFFGARATFVFVVDTKRKTNYCKMFGALSPFIFSNSVPLCDRSISEGVVTSNEIYNKSAPTGPATSGANNDENEVNDTIEYKEDTIEDSKVLQESHSFNGFVEEVSSSSSGIINSPWKCNTCPPLVQALEPKFPTSLCDFPTESVNETIELSRRTKGSTINPLLRQYLEHNLQRWQPSVSQNESVSLDENHPYQSELLPTEMKIRGAAIAVLKWFRSPVEQNFEMVAKPVHDKQVVANPTVLPPCLQGSHIIPNTSCSVLVPEEAHVLPDVQNPSSTQVSNAVNAATPYGYPLLSMVANQEPSDLLGDNDVTCFAQFTTMCLF